MFDLKGKKALITGSTQGIGFEAAKILAEHGAKVFVCGATSEQKTKAASEKIFGSVPVTVNLSDPQCDIKLSDKTGDIDILVLNASIQIRKPFEELTDIEIREQIAVNFQSSIKLIQKYVPYMKKQKWGRIVIVGSVQQTKPHKDMLIYAAMKSAMLNVCKNLAKQLAPFNITVNNIAPGVIATPRNVDALKDADYMSKVLSGIPCGRAGAPSDCAAQILLLCSDEGNYITGSDIYIDGGMML